MSSLTHPSGPLAGVTVQPPRTRLRHRLAARGVDWTLLLLLPALLVLAALFLYPFVYGVMISVQPRTGGMFSNYTDFFTDHYQFSSVARTLRLAIPVAVCSVAFAAPIAYQARRERKIQAA